MDPTRTLIRRVILAAVLPLSLLVSCASAQSVPDRLNTPALLSFRSAETLMLDIAASGDQLVAVGDQGVVMRSVDQGRSWQQQQTPFSVMLTSVCFADSRHGWLTGHDGLLAATDDGGVSWHTQLNGDQINTLRLQRLQEVAAELQARADAKPDNTSLAEQLDSVSWLVEDATVAQEGGATVPLLDIWFADAQHGFALGGYGLLLKTVNGGESWAYWGDRLDNPDNFHLNAITADHQGYLYIAGEAGLLFRSTDGGDSWRRIDIPYDGSFFGITEFNKQLYLMGLRGHLYRSATGLEWSPVDTGYSATLLSAVAGADKLVLLGQGGLILQSRDGEIFTQQDSGGRRSLSAGVALQGRYVLVGEGGLLTLEAGHE